MARLLPSTPDLSAAEQSSPRVIGIDGDEADDLLSAMSSGTARSLLSALHDEPATPSELASRVDTSLQNAQYHLGNLADAGMIEVIDTVYSEKGREMKVYAPADRPLVVVAGGEEQTRSLRSAVSRLLGGLLVLAMASVLVQTALRGFPLGFGMTGAGGGDGAAPAADGGDGGGAGGGGDAGVMGVESTPTPQATETARAVAESAGPGFPFDLLAEPGFVFFAGGLAVLLVVVAVWYVRR